MSPLRVATIGSYPRTGEEKDHQRYPRALGHFERKEISAHALRDVEQSVVQEIIREQIDHGADEITDGLLTWADPIGRFCRNLSNVKTGGLARYFDNNFYYRVRVLSGTPRLSAPDVADYAFSKANSNRPLRAVLTGPLTLARHTRATVKAFDKVAARIDLFTQVLAREIAALAAAGAPVVQIDEPSLASASPEERKLAAAAFGKMAAAKGAAKIALAVYFGPVTPLLPFLCGLPADILQLDLTADGAAAIQLLATAPPRAIIGLGATDGRSTRLETPSELSFLVDPFLDKAVETVYLTPSCGLEFLPRASAIAKIDLLTAWRNELNASGGKPRA